MTAIQRRHQRVFPSAPSEVLLAKLYTVLCGLRVISSRMRYNAIIFLHADHVSELFGTSEADAPELDHSEDADNGMTKSLFRILTDIH